MKLTFTYFTSLLLLLNFNAFSNSHDYEIDGEKFEGYVLTNKKSSPLVIIVHDWDGLDKYEIKRSQMLKKMGYSVFALDMFGKGIRPAEISERKRLTGALYKDRTRMRKLMNGALSEAKKLGLNVKNASTVGYCFGGTSVLEWAKSGANLNGFVSFHGNLGPKENDSYKNTKSKIMVFHGTADKIVPMQEFADLATLLEKENIPHEMITYSGAPHAFTKFGTERYRKEADERSWIRYSSFLKDQHKM
jgi:dienelactone hydrolase